MPGRSDSGARGGLCCSEIAGPRWRNGSARQSRREAAARVGGSRGVRGRYLKGGGAPWACAPGFGKPASVSAEIAGFSCARGKTGLTVGPGCQWSRATRGESGRAERSTELGCGCGPRASGRVRLGVERGNGPLGLGLAGWAAHGLGWIGRQAGLGRGRRAGPGEGSGPAGERGGLRVGPG